MSNVGALAANFHEGSRSEYLAQYVFASFGTAVSVPHQEDQGVDLYCTLTERIGSLAWPRFHYTVQVKSGVDPWKFGSPDSVRWLVEHPLPLFLCVLDKPTTRLRLYHTFPRFLVWVTGSKLPDTLELVPADGPDGHSTQWDNGTTFSLGAPILDRTIQDLLDDTIFNEARAVLEFWLREETRSLARIAMGLPVFSMPSEYKTNATAIKGTVFQWSTLPERFHGVRATLAETLPWLAEAYRRQDDLRGAARAALLSRYLTPNRDDSTAPDPLFVQFFINTALGLKPTYVFEGVDLLATTLDNLLARPSAPSSVGAA